MSSTKGKSKGGLGARIQRVKEGDGYIPFPALAALLLILLVVEIVFCAMVVNMGILPGQYIALIIVCLLAIDAGIVALILNGSGGRKRYYTGLIIGALMLVLLLPGTYFVMDAGSALEKLTRESKQWEKYDVVAMKDSAYETVEDITGKTVYVLPQNDKMTTEAQEKLVTKASVNLDDTDKDIVSLSNRICDEKGQVHDELILLSDSQYGMLCDDNKAFKKNSKVIYTEKVMRRSDAKSSDIDVTKDPFNIYVTGIDIWGEIDKVSRSDVNMIVTVNPQTRTILLTSMPRDSYVPLHSFGQLDKLTHSGIYGVDETLNTVSDWLDVDFDYYVKINFSMVVKLINAMGGISVYSDYEFDSAISDWHYVKGKNRLSGKGALYFARERKAFEKSDEQRIRNQQKVMEGIINKVTSHKEILLNYNELLSIVGENMATNLSDDDLKALARMQLKDMDTKWTVEKYSIDGEDATMGTYSMGMGRPLFVSIPDEKSVEKAKEKIHDVMYPETVEEEPKSEMEKLVEDQLDPQTDATEETTKE